MRAHLHQSRRGFPGTLSIHWQLALTRASPLWHLVFPKTTREHTRERENRKRNERWKKSRYKIAAGKERDIRICAQRIARHEEFTLITRTRAPTHEAPTPTSGTVRDIIDEGRVPRSDYRRSTLHVDRACHGSVHTRAEGWGGAGRRPRIVSSSQP